VMTTSTNTISLTLQSEKNLRQLMDVKLVLGQGVDSQSFHSVTLNKLIIKKFQFFILSNSSKVAPPEKSFVKGVFDQVIELMRFAKWVDSAFALNKGRSLKNLIIKHDELTFEVKGVDVRNGMPLSIFL